MAKVFAPRVAKKDRSTLDLSDKLTGRDLFKQLSNELLFKGATLDEIFLKEIVVKEQVRTKFNDDTIRELAENIRVNGLIQPLVIHRESSGKYRLICGERRFRAMSLIKMEKAPCFILHGKSEEELMAIQFSENSARENLHYVDRAEGIYNYQKTTNDSERKIVVALGISKSEVHRSIIIGKLPVEVKEAAKKFDIEKYVLLEYDAIQDQKIKKEVEMEIIAGKIVKRSQLKKIAKIELSNPKHNPLFDESMDSVAM